MELKRLVSVAMETQGTIDKYKDTYTIVEFQEQMQLCAYLDNINQKERTELLLIAATDKCIEIGKRYGVAIMGYLNPIMLNQSLSGVEYLVEGFEEVEASFLESVYKRFYHLPWTIANTKRCMIRELQLSDMDALFALYEDKEMTKYTEALYPYEEELEYQRAYINNMYRYYGYGMWLVIEKETGKVIGRAGLEHREFDGETEVELGYLIAPEYQRKGYATEVCQAIIDFFDSEVDMPRLNCVMDEANVASVKLAEKLGFSYMETIVLQERKMLRFVRKQGIIKH